MPWMLLSVLGTCQILSYIPKVPGILHEDLQRESHQLAHHFDFKNIWIYAHMTWRKVADVPCFSTQRLCQSNLFILKTWNKILQRRRLSISQKTRIFVCVPKTATPKPVRHFRTITRLKADNRILPSAIVDIMDPTLTEIIHSPRAEWNISQATQI
jgi:hypothetical protein